MPDDPRNDSDSGGFDDWLSEAPSKATDPYAELSIDAPNDDVDEPRVEPQVDPAVEPGPEELVVAETSEVVDPESEPEPEVEPVETPVADDLVADDDGDDDTSEVPNIPESEPETEAGFEDDTGDIPQVQDDSSGPVESAAEPVEVHTKHAEPMVDFEEFDGVDEADTDELEIIAPAASGEIDGGEHEATLMYDGGLVPDALPSEHDEAGDDVESAEDVASDVPIVAWFPEADEDVQDSSEDDSPLDAGGGDAISPDVEDTSGPEDFDPFEDTGEAVFVSGEMASAAAAAFGDLWDQDGEEAAPEGSVASPVDLGEFTLDEDDLLSGATQEHIGLAAAIAAAETEETEQVALVAEIPGLETSVVGFEDVVEAEGHRRVRARSSGDLIARIVTGLILILALGASLIWRPALAVFAIAVFVLGAGEFYTALVRTGRKPIALFGFIGIVGASAGAYFWSAVAIPMAFVLATILLLLFYAVVPGKSDPMGNLALTTTVMVWAGLGSFAMLIVQSDDYQVLIIGVVLAVASADIAAFFVGRSLGRTHFAPWISPKKTVEGLVAGVIVAFGVGAMLHFFPPFELTSGLAIGAAAAFLTPIGDLAMSAAKRSIGLKDMGSVLPGHGGFLDRIDGLLFVIPMAWAVFIWAGLL